MAVRARIGMVRASSRSRDRIIFVALYPSITGICISIRIPAYSPGAEASNFLTAMEPFSAVSIRRPCVSSSSTAISRLSSLSSASRSFLPTKAASDLSRRALRASERSILQNLWKVCTIFDLNSGFVIKASAPARRNLSSISEKS